MGENVWWGWIIDHKDGHLSKERLWRLSLHQENELS